MPLHTSTGTPTKAQQARFTAIKLDTGCVACRLQGLGYCEPEIHHLGVGKRRGHDETVGLCGWHHRAVLPDGWTAEAMRGRYGPSLARGSKPFHKHFGSDDVLLDEQERLLLRFGYGRKAA